MVLKIDGFRCDPRHPRIGGCASAWADKLEALREYAESLAGTHSEAADYRLPTPSIKKQRNFLLLLGFEWSENMKPRVRDPDGQVVKTIAAIGCAVALAVFCHPLYVSRLPPVPRWVAVRAKQNAPRVRVGMTDAQVWSTLGLAGRGLRTRVNGSGPTGAWPSNYVLWPGYVVHARWDLRNHPATLVAFRFQARL